MRESERERVFVCVCVRERERVCVFENLLDIRFEGKNCRERIGEEAFNCRQRQKTLESDYFRKKICFFYLFSLFFVFAMRLAFERETKKVEKQMVEKTKKKRFVLLSV